MLSRRSLIPAACSYHCLPPYNSTSNATASPPLLLRRLGDLQVALLRPFATSAAKPGSSSAKSKKPPLPKRGALKGGEDRPDEDRRYKNLVDACLNAPPLVRFLKEKDRLREMEREKLGIVSKEREREIEQQKEREKAAAKAAKKKAKGKEPEVQNKEGLEEQEEDNVTEAETARKMELTVEEGKRLAKESSRILMHEERERQAGESMRLKLKLAAIAALPEHLRIKAMEPDLTPFPSNRIPASLTPPVEGYMKEMAKVAQKVTTTKKMR
ncbi:hypothetical protein O6H91_21G051200 [Diphasiastrum complanatum]|nr:hypothetical protein O6H91_21G051200 [Diphasiastrum complanatum]